MAPLFLSNFEKVWGSKVMQVLEKNGPKAPKDPTKKRPFFFIMQGERNIWSPFAPGQGNTIYLRK